MKYFALFSLILICAFTIAAQTPPPAPAVLPTPYGETAEAWQNFAPEDEFFALESPGQNTPDLIASEQTMTPKSRYYMTLVGGDYYFIFADSTAEPRYNRVVYNFAESQAPGIEPNEIYAFADEFGYHHKILITKIGDRVYTFQTVSRTKNAASVKRFFDGIKIKGMKLQAKEIEALQNIPAENPKIACDAAPVKPAENLTIGNTANSNPPPAAQGSGISSGEAVKKTPAVTSAIRIISKPRANYTDLARFYKTTGAVTLRVTFLANGQIGAISPVGKLPFGLTEEAVNAACQVRFEPQSKDGVPYTVIKQVQYNFVLY